MQRQERGNAQRRKQHWCGDALVPRPNGNKIRLKQLGSQKNCVMLSRREGRVARSFQYSGADVGEAKWNPVKTGLKERDGE